MHEQVVPDHYKQGQVDLIESWYRTYPFNEFVSIMESHISKYVKRHRDKNGVNDLDKASEYIRRLKEYHSIELSKQ